eukprot:g8186.t1
MKRAGMCFLCATSMSCFGWWREDDRTRQADLAANRLLQRMSAQLMFPDLEAEVELSMRQWREEQPETTLSTIVAPWLLKSAKMCAESGMPDELPPGALSRSIESLSRTMRLEEISLLSAEWALAPFEKADASSEAITWVSSSCAKGGVAEVILSDACSGWLASGCSLGSLGVEQLGSRRDTCMNSAPSCPPLSLKVEDLDQNDSSDPCSPAKLSAQYGVVVQTAAQSLRHVWRTASRHHAPRRYRAYARLLSSMLEIECIAVFSGCFPGGWHQETESSGRACGFFRAEVNAVLELDHETEADSAYKQLGLPSVDVEKLARHPCYTASPQVRSIDIMEHLTLRSMAVALGSNMFQGTDSQVVPLWVPAFGAHPAHSPSCDDSELLWWYNAPALPRLPSLLQKGWAINLGAGDGSCGYADDPANCLLQEGFAGIMFEGAETKLAKLKEEFERRPDVVLVLGHTDPDEVVAHVAAFRHRLPPVEAELLKVDFDNCDCCFVEALLQSGIRPRHLHVEVSCFIPPPLVFRPTSFDESIGQLNFAESHENLDEFQRILKKMWEEIEGLDAGAVRADEEGLQVKRQKADQVQRELQNFKDRMNVEKMKANTMLEMSDRLQDSIDSAYDELASLGDCTKARKDALKKTIHEFRERQKKMREDFDKGKVTERELEEMIEQWQQDLDKELDAIREMEKLGNPFQSLARAARAASKLIMEAAASKL